MACQFETLRVWNRALEYDDYIVRFSAALPKRERFGLIDQSRRASASIALNIAEGSTSQSDGDKQRFLGYAIGSLLETVAALHLARRRGYAVEPELFDEMYTHSELLFRELQAFRASVQRRRATTGGRGRK